MSEWMDGNKLKGSIAEFRRLHPGGQYPKLLRNQGGQYVMERRSLGIRWRDIALELGVQVGTLQSWAARPGIRCPAPVERRACPTEPTLIPVVVRRENISDGSENRIEVEFPNGIRLRAIGLRPDALEQMMRAAGVLR